MSTTEDVQFEELLEYIERELDFESGFYNEAYLKRRITARMRRTDIDSFGAYQRLLTEDGEECAALLDSLSINVTGFFRNPDAWENLRPVLRELTAEGSARAWSAPCADGREPYSMAMLARDDPEIDARHLSILGTDINEEILTAARRGEYETSTTTDIESELAPVDEYTDYVDRDGDHFVVKNRIKRMVEFERHDLIRGPAKHDYDLICCRNLLIYIDADYKVPIFETIRNSLRTGGYLMIGMTETLPTECRDAFEPVDKRHRIYRTVE